VDRSLPFQLRALEGALAAAAAGLTEEAAALEARALPAADRLARRVRRPAWPPGRPAVFCPPEARVSAIALLLACRTLAGAFSLCLKLLDKRVSNCASCPTRLVVHGTARWSSPDHYSSLARTARYQAALQLLTHRP